MFGNSFIIGMVLKFLAQKGIELLDTVSKEYLPKVEKYLQDALPDFLDAPAVKILDAVWETLVEAAKALAGQYAGISTMVASEEEKEMAKEAALAKAVAAVKPHIEKALA